MMEQQLRELVRQRAQNRCEYCLLPDSAYLLPFHVEHIIARQHGGTSEMTNLAWACARCNAYKGPNLSSIDPDSGTIVELFHPRRHIWAEHFRNEVGIIVALTATGRATVRLLQFNSRERVEHRRDLLDLGLLNE
jgi:hypothetical protein